MGYTADRAADDMLRWVRTWRTWSDDYDLDAGILRRHGRAMARRVPR
jgi:hypothetical protein